ncbi:sulfotransferase family protein [Novipirellula maiorica]|nr:sulfotransferase [Rhodopirellula maiorica]
MSTSSQTKVDSKSADGTRPFRFIFVGGSARSGTTLVQKMLCAHSCVCGGPEFDHAVPAMKLFARMSSPQQLERQKFYYSEEEVSDRFREFYASLFDGLASRNPGLKYVSEKTPANIAAAADLLRLFPDAFYVNVMRDGRDVVLSHQKVLNRFKQQHGKKGKKWWFEYSVRDVSRKWNSDIERYYEMMASDSISPRIMNVKYEEIVSHPEKVLKPILEKLGLDFEPQLSKPESVDKEQLGYNVNVDGVWYTDGMFDQSLNSLSVSGWQKNLSWPKRMLVNFMQCRNLQRVGYPVPPSVLRLRHIVDYLRGR